MKHRNRTSGQVVFKGCYDGRGCIFINNKGPRVIGFVRIGQDMAKTIDHFSFYVRINLVGVIIPLWCLYWESFFFSCLNRILHVILQSFTFFSGTVFLKLQQSNFNMVIPVF